MICYDKAGPVCMYCVPTHYKGTYHGMPRYKCIHPVEYDDPIDLDKEATCPEYYKRVDR